MVYTFPFTSTFSIHFPNALGIVLNAPTIIAITVTIIFLRFFIILLQDLRISCLNFWDEAWWFFISKFLDYCLRFHYFVLLSEEILFLSNGFCFLAMSKFSRVRFILFVTWSVHRVFSFPFFCPLMFAFSFLLLMSLIVLIPRLCMWSFSRCIYPSKLSWMLQNLFLLLFLTYIASLCSLYYVIAYAGSWFLFCIFLISGRIVDVLLSSILRMDVSIFLCQIPFLCPYCISSMHAKGLFLLSFTSLLLFKSMLADGFSLEFEWQQVSSSLQDSSQDSSRAQQCCHLVSLYPSVNLQVLQAF